MRRVNIGIVGATGMVGRTFLKILEERNFPIDNLYLFSSKKSAGSKVEFCGKEYIVEELNENSFDRDMDIALFSAGGSISKKFAPIARDHGVIVVDNSSAWRMDKDIPLVVPEVNPQDIDWNNGIIANPNCSTIQSHGVIVVDNSSAWRMDKDIPLVVPEVNPQDIDWNNGIIANPNCSTIQSVVPLKPLHDAFKIKRVIYSSYQAVSGSGVEGINDLENGINGGENKKYPHQIAYNCIPHIDDFLDNGYTKEEIKMIEETKKILNDQDMKVTNKKYPHQIAYNCIPHIDDFLDNGYTKEEIKMIEETKKILNDQDMKVTATTVRVPVKYGHSVSINVEFEKNFDMDEVFEVLKNGKGIIVKDDIVNNVYPMAIDAEGKDEVYVGRIRRDYSVENGINLWVVADNIRKGAATNTVQIAELLINRRG